MTYVNGTSAESQNPEVMMDGAAKYDVTLTSWNLNGSSESTQIDMILSGGYEPYFLETFESSTFISEEWIIVNPDDDVTWDYYEVGGTVPGNMSAGIDFSEYLFIGERDRLISPPINLQGLSSAVLEFQHAYAQRYSSMTDSLIVNISDDCGNTWTKILSAGANGSGSLATHELTDGDFWPEISDDWCMSGWGASCFVLDLSQWAGKANIKIAFESYSGFGNPMFIDNISVSQFVGQNESIEEDVDFIVYPNPTGGAFTVEISNPEKYKTISLVNHLGQEVYTSELDGKQKRFMVEKQNEWSPGIYFIRLTGNVNSSLKKLILY